MKRLAHLPPPKPWRALLVGSIVLVAITSVVLWNWRIIDQREQAFETDVKSISQQVEERMRAYEMALRGVGSAFAGEDPRISYAQWVEVSKQLRVQELYPGISSITWSRRLRAADVPAFAARIHVDGRPDFSIFPEGQRDTYMPIVFISPINPRTTRVIGLDLLTQEAQQNAINRAIDSGHTTLTRPMPDLYEVTSPEERNGMGLLMYFPVYRDGIPPATLEARRATFDGLTSAAFRGVELAEGIFGPLLQMFNIQAHDVETGLQLFHTQTLPVPASGWTPRFHASVDLPMYERTWRLSITGTQAYEHSLTSRSQMLSLALGLITALLLALVAAGGVYHHDHERYASHLVSVHLQEEAQQLVLANRYKSEFLANMSHELRTPLNSILILSDQLRQNTTGNLSEKQTRHADIVYRAGSDLLQLINDVLDLSKIEAGRMQMSMEPLNLQDLLVDLEASMHPLAEAKGLHLHIPPVSTAAGTPQRVFSDRVRLHQILRNLLSNAIKFTEHGQIHLLVSAHQALADGRIVVSFSVRDTGIGIPADQHERVFKAFAQLDGSTRRRFGGTGLGLAITRQLVHALEGEIEMVSAPGQGSTFTVNIPMQTVPDLAPAEIPPPQRSGEGPALLIVEDDPNFAAIIIEQANSHGFSSVHCSTATQALALLREEAFAAIILDILLPDISGWQLFRNLRALPAHKHTPVHIISCLPQPGGLQEDHGVHYLTKPVGPGEVEQVFANLQQEQKTALNPALLLVEDVTAEREHYRQRLSALGFAVTACASASEAGTVWSGQTFSVLVIDLNLPDGDGFSLLETLDRLRPLQGTRIVVNTGIDVTREGLQRLNSYSAVVVRKQGEDTRALGQAVQGFLGQISNGNGNGGNGAAPAAVQAADAAPVETAINLDGRRLLLVDDDVRNVYALSALLDEFGLDIVTAGNGEEAIAAFLREPFDLILMDMSMPVMDGYTATNLLKTEHACTIPVIALTAHAMKGDREKCLAVGADDYIAKPVNRDELRALLERWLAPAGAQPA